jgi:DNA processing protein
MAATTSELAALVALAALPGIGPATLQAIGWAGSIDAWAAVSSGRSGRHRALASIGPRGREHEARRALEEAAQSIDPDRFLECHLAHGIVVVAHGQPGYPPRLADDPSPPALVFIDGSLDALDGPVIGIVGTRNATQLGCDTAAGLATDLARCGVSIASGLALGIDGAAHRPLVDGRVQVPPGAPIGRPIAVVAAGLDHRYPRRHAGLHDEVARVGAVISEVPFGVEPTRWRFPARNRIIAALADALLVVESRSAGGSMITVKEALDRGTTVLAVPGHPSAAASAGTLDLICEGAIPVRDAGDVLVAIGRGGADVAAQRSASRSDGHPLPADDDAATRAVLGHLERGPATLDSLLLGTARSLAEVSSVLVRLEAGERIVRSGGWFELRRSAAGARPLRERRR